MNSYTNCSNFPIFPQTFRHLENLVKNSAAFLTACDLAVQLYAAKNKRSFLKPPIITCGGSTIFMVLQTENELAISSPAPLCGIRYYKFQSVGVRACESAIAHVRAEIQVRKGCEASWNCACEVRACGGIYGVRSQVRSHLKFYQ